MFQKWVGYLTIVYHVFSITQMGLVVIREVSCSVWQPMLQNTNPVMTGVTTPEKHILNQKENVKLKVYMTMNEQNTDNVNHPAHYNSHPSGIECIEIARHHNFNIGNTIKYLWRAGLKSEEGMEDTDKQVEDLNKAIWYLKDEIKRITEFENKTKL